MTPAAGTMADRTITNAQVVLEDRVIAPGTIRISNGLISSIEPGGSFSSESGAIDAGGRQVTAGLVDIHTHGIGNYLYESSPEQLVGGAHLLPSFGTTSFLPTLYTVLGPNDLEHIARLADAAMRCGGSRIAGFHLEGPFLALSGAAGRQLKVDLGLLKDLLAACKGLTRVMSVSPELPGIIPAIEFLQSQNIRVFMTHTAANCEQTRRAIDAGATHATHFYDVFPVPKEIEPGVRPAGAVEAILADPRTTVDFIADGIHVDPEAIRLAGTCKGWNGVALISDSNIGAGLPAGRYNTLWGFPIRVSPSDAARIDDPGHPEYGGLAGSSLVLSRAVANIQRWFSLPWNIAWGLASANPSRIAGISNAGTLAIGRPADLVIWNADLTPYRTLIAGEVVFESNSHSSEASHARF